MDQISELIQQTISHALKELKLKQNEIIRRLKKNSILATADWSLVERAIDIQSPYDQHDHDEFNSDSSPSRRYMDHINCDHCQAHVTIPISKFEFDQTFEDCRIRILRCVIFVTLSNDYEPCLSNLVYKKHISGRTITMVNYHRMVYIH